MNSDFFILALRNLKKRKLRSFLTILGIFISVATIFLLISLSLGLQGAIEEQFRLLGTDKFFIQARGQSAGPGTEGAVMLTQADVDVIDKIPGIKEITYFMVSPAKIESGKEIKFTNVGGIPLDSTALYFESFSLDVEEGRFLEEGDTGEVVVGSQYKGQFLDVDIGNKIKINDKPFRVKGILEPVGNPQDDRFIYMSEEDFRLLFSIEERIDGIMVQVEGHDKIEEVSERVERKLRSSRDVTEKTQDFTILLPEQILESFGTVLAIITGFLGGIAAISLIVGGIGIANTMYTSVLERTKEIGVMKAVGAKNSDITTIFLIESGLLGLIGGAIGVILGIAAGKLIEYIAVNQLATNLLTIATPAWLIVACLAFAFLAGAISGTLPAMRAAKIKPTEALRYE